MIRIKKVTLSTKLRSFQYRLINFALITNVQLSDWKIVAVNTCTFCSKYPEHYLHLFCHCTHVVNKIWKSLRKWLKYFCNIDLELEPQEIIFSCYKDSFQDMVNVIILIMKHFIYVQRCLKGRLEFVALVSKITNYQMLEHFIAKKTR